MATRKTISKQNLSEAMNEPPIEETVERVLTVGGKPIDSSIAHLIPFANTDQGIAERMNNGKPKARVEVLRDAFDKQFDRRADVSEPWESEDPMREIVDSVREQGMGYRFLSPRVIERKGKRKYEVVVGENGDPVMFGNMVLGQMPEDLQAKRAEYYRRLGEEELDRSRENMQVQQEKLMRDNPDIGNVILDTGAEVDGRRTGIHRARGSELEAA